MSRRIVHLDEEWPASPRVRLEGARDRWVAQLAELPLNDRRRGEIARKIVSLEDEIAKLPAEPASS